MSSLLIWLLAVGGLPAVAEEVHHFEITSSTAAAAIQEFGMQSGVQILAAGEGLEGKRFNAITGDLSTEQALLSLLAGSGMTHRYIGERAVALVAEEGLAPAGVVQIAAPGAPVAAEPLKRGFRGRVHLDRAASEASVVGDDASGANAEAHSATRNAARNAASELEEVIVTGSNIRRSGAQIDHGAIPIETISAEEFRAASGESIANFLQSRPTFTGSNGNPANDYYGGGESTLNLRGLGAQYTLVLINGRRAAGEDGIADVGAIPEEAVESIEILKSGASAIYGANAVGGVVNIKLKQEYQGVEFTTSYGNTTNHDASYRRAAVLFGAGTERLRLMGSFAWQDRNGIEPGDRELTATNDWRRFGGQDARTDFFYAPQFISGIDDAGYALDTSRFTPGQTSLDPDDFRAGPIEQSFNRFDTGHLPANSRIGGHWSAQFDLLAGGGAVLFTEGYYDQRKQLFHPLGLPIIGGPGFSPLIVPADNPFNPFGQEVGVGYFVGPNEYPHRVENRFKTDALLGTTGVRGDIGEFSYEVSYSRFQQKRHSTWANDFDSALAQAAIDDGRLNVFGYWANSPALINSLVAPPRTSTVENTSDTLTAKLTGKLFELPAGPLQFAVGAERREIGYEESHDRLKQTISTFWDSAETEAGKFEREVDAYFGELSVPIYRNHGSLLSSIEASVAMRHEKYDDFGDTDVPQGALRFGMLQDSLILRASYAEGFRAPSLEELTPFSGLVQTSGIYDPYFDDFVEVFYQTGGNPDLKAEVGVTRNIGIVFTPGGTGRLTLRADWWQVKQQDTIETPTFTEVLLGRQPGTVTRDPITGIATVDARYSNTGDRKIEGIDLGIYYRTEEFSFGEFAFDFSSSILTQVEHTFGDTTVDGLGYYTSLFGGMSRSRSVLATTWRFGNWELASFLHYEPGVKETEVIMRKTDDYTTGDLQLAYEFDTSYARSGLLAGSRIYAGVENFWDEELPFFASTYLGWQGSLHDLRGRYYYAGLKKKF